jgi:hypothetical protein
LCGQLSFGGGVETVIKESVMLAFFQFLGVSAICSVGWPLIAYLRSDWEDPEGGDRANRVWAVVGAAILIVLLWSMASGNVLSFIIAAATLVLTGLVFGGKMLLSLLVEAWPEENPLPQPPPKPSKLGEIIHVCFTWWYPELRAIHSWTSIDRLSVIAFIGAEIDMVLLVATWYGWWQVAICLGLAHLIVTCLYHWLNEPQCEEE